MPQSWTHLHLPRLRSGDTTDVISVKVPGQPIRYSSWIRLSEVSFRVSEAGRQRCIRENVRNVHAWVVGTEEESGTGDVKWIVDRRTYRQAIYDPFKGPDFVDSLTLLPVFTAREVLFVGKTVLYSL